VTGFASSLRKTTMPTMTLADFTQITECTVRNLERRLGKSRDQILADAEMALEPHRAIMDAVRSKVDGFRNGDGES
jgi:hypothetical protein